MVAEGVPRQLAYQAVVLVKIVPAMSEDYVGREGFLEFFEAFFDRWTEVGKEPVSKGFYDDRLARALAAGKPWRCARLLWRASDRHQARASKTRCSSTARAGAGLFHRSQSRCRRCAPPGTAPASRDSDRTKSFLDFVLMIPHRPGRSAPAEDVLKVLLFLEGVHAGPDSRHAGRPSAGLRRSAAGTVPPPVPRRPSCN